MPRSAILCNNNACIFGPNEEQSRVSKMGESCIFCTEGEIERKLASTPKAKGGLIKRLRAFSPGTRTLALGGVSSQDVLEGSSRHLF